MTELCCIYLDLDGVKVDLYRAICEDFGGTGNEPYEIAPVVDYEVIWKVVLPKLTGRPWTQDDFKVYLESKDEEFWENLPKYPWADELWDLCNETAPTVIMTSPWVIPTAASGKMRWLSKNRPDMGRFAITSVKHHFSHPGALLIDDRDDDCERFRSAKYGGDAYTFPQPWSCLDWKDRNPLEELRELFRKRMS